MDKLTTRVLVLFSISIQTQSPTHFSLYDFKDSELTKKELERYCVWYFGSNWSATKSAYDRGSYNGFLIGLF
jgi:hypothetical protein